MTSAGGSYSIDLPAGTYKLFVQPDEPGYADQWDGGADHPRVRPPIALSANTTGVAFPLVGHTP